MRSPQLTNQHPQAKPEEAELRLLLNQARNSTELQAVLRLAAIRQSVALANFRKATGFEELVKYQQRLNAWHDVVEAITQPLRTVQQPVKGE